MQQPSNTNPFQLAPTDQDPITSLLKAGAQKMLQAAIHEEVNEYLALHAGERDEHGMRLVVRNGRAPKREFQTGLGSIEIQRPRINDRRFDENGNRIRFSSSVLPGYLRRTKSIEDLIPWLYLKGVSSGDFSEALGSLLGPNAAGLTAGTIVRLKKVVEQDCADWNKRDLTGKRYAYIWVDGIHFNIRLEEDRQCILVVIGATEDGKKELLAVEDGTRESEQSWRELLLGLKARGLTNDPELAIGDGALGFWKALPQVWPKTKWQRCWVHKTANVLAKLPKKAQPKAKDALHQIWMAETEQDANKAFDLFIDKYQAKYPRAATCLGKHRDDMLAFYSFPAEHWKHIRTTNPIESTFATVRLRTKRTKGAGSRMASLTMVFKLAQAAERKWRKLDGYELLGDVIRGVQFKDGIKVAA